MYKQKENSAKNLADTAPIPNGAELNEEQITQLKTFLTAWERLEEEDKREHYGKKFRRTYDKESEEPGDPIKLIEDSSETYLLPRSILVQEDGTMLLITHKVLGEGASSRVKEAYKIKLENGQLILGNPYVIGVQKIRKQDYNKNGSPKTFRALDEAKRSSELFTAVHGNTSVGNASWLERKIPEQSLSSAPGTIVKKNYIIMPKIQGKSYSLEELHALRLEEKERYHLIIAYLQAVINVHEKNIVHADIKPENFILFFPNPHNRLNAKATAVDFGFAAYSHIEWMRNIFRGTPGFTAPETKRTPSQTPNITQKSDVWSLGVILFNLLYPEGAPGDLHKALRMENSAAQSSKLKDIIDQLTFPNLIGEDDEYIKDFLFSIFCGPLNERPDLIKLKAALNTFEKISNRMLSPTISWSEATRYVYSGNKDKPLSTSQYIGIMPIEENKNAAIYFVLNLFSGNIVFKFLQSAAKLIESMLYFVYENSKVRAKDYWNLTEVSGWYGFYAAILGVVCGISGLIYYLLKPLTSPINSIKEAYHSAEGLKGVVLAVLCTLYITAAYATILFFCWPVIACVGATVLTSSIFKAITSFLSGLLSSAPAVAQAAQAIAITGVLATPAVLAEVANNNLPKKKEVTNNSSKKGEGGEEKTTRSRSDSTENGDRPFMTLDDRDESILLTTSTTQRSSL